LCYSLFRLAEAHCAAAPSDRDAASAVARECLRMADDLASVTGNDIRALARRFELEIELPATTTAEPPARVPDIRLTLREREVLALLTEGRTNGQIATRLVISTKTASVHVSNILAKLGVATRTEAATMVHRLGLLVRS
jgi:DNA-binding NarL/FixJ family response regulator